MSTIDLSRSVTDYRKHYTGVDAQMGRVLTDDDHNDNERIHGEDMRRSRLDVIGPAGSPDAGFSIDPASLVITATSINFDIVPGTFYLGGNRLTLESTEKFLTQSDWLNMLPADLPPVPAAARTDLVYLECWYQPVAAVEDSELFEVALGGPDTGTRTRLMRRVHVLPGVTGGDCSTDWATLTAQWTADGLGTLDANAQLTVDTTLTVAFVPGPPGDLCTPAIAGGYLGAENQAIRVQIVDATHFVWGFDNAAPLYRVTVAADNKTITMLTEPRDQPHWPVAGQIVELLPWSAVLANGEKIAEVSGHLDTVNSSYDPDTGQLTMTTGLPPGFGTEWQGRADAANLGTTFFYMRVWNRASDTASPPNIPFVDGTAVTLGNTGLSVTFQGADHHPGDFWIIAARPETPNLVVPWQLSLAGGRGPNGFRRWYTPLAELQWAPGGTGSVIDDCRDTFPPLTRLDHCCCKFTVGDGVTSFGDFTVIQEAINALPMTGGEICIKAGTYRQNFSINARQDVKIHGCGSQTLLLDGGKATNPIITITNSEHIRVCNLRIEAPAVIGILLDTAPVGKNKLSLNIDITLDQLQMVARDVSAIDCRAGQTIVIEHNELTAIDLDPNLKNQNAGRYALVFLRADDSLVERNDLLVDGARAAVRPLGGVQVGGGSERVAVRRNLIRGGNGNGITLGSITYQDPNGNTTVGTGGGWTIDPNGCIVPTNPTDPTGPGGPLTPTSDGDLLDIWIIDNEIIDMGQCGISTLRYFDVGLISVRRLQIELNRIRRCVQLELGGRPFTSPLLLGYGGVSLMCVDQLTARNNFIEDCGLSYIEPICGIYVLLGRGVLVEGNQILNNGPRTRTAKQPTAGPRGGIVIAIAMLPTLGIASAAPGTGFPAARITGNTVVVPFGRALYAVARGPVSVNDNALTSRGVDGGATSGVAVLIFNLGVTYEVAQFTGFSNMGLNQPQSGLSSVGVGAKVRPDGEILFSDNQVLLAPVDSSGGALGSSVELVSGDDVQFDDNQCEARVGRETLISNGLALGWSVRMNSNRFEEALTPGVSGFTIGLFNCTALNQGTRCFAALGNSSLLEFAGNKSMTTLLAVLGGTPDPCAALRKRLTSLAPRWGLSA